MWFYILSFVHHFSSQYDKARKQYLAELEAKGAQLCKEHGKILHQIEHMQWHLEGCKHKPCHKSKENLAHHHHPHHHHHHGSEKKLNTATSAGSSVATNTTMGGGSVGTVTTPRPSQLANLRNSSERIIKDIIELRKRSHILQERLEHEIKVNWKTCCWLWCGAKFQGFNANYVPSCGPPQFHTAFPTRFSCCICSIA